MGPVVVEFHFYFFTFFLSPCCNDLVILLHIPISLVRNWSEYEIPAAMHESLEADTLEKTPESISEVYIAGLKIRILSRISVYYTVL